MKADLPDTNLNCTNLDDINMLGIKWTGSKFINVKKGRK
ncbi:MAG: hypothetical protein ACI9U5_000625 [Colwellia sp.]|jgi:uncharacterized protein YjbI with pentapeptide repeats